jgi:hypothetical protein
MGRGRAKAKQTKVARDLKYNSGGFDLDRLRADLGTGEPALTTAEADSELDDEDDPDDLDDVEEPDEDEADAATR